MEMCKIQSEIACRSHKMKKVVRAYPPSIYLYIYCANLTYILHIIQCYFNLAYSRIGYFQNLLIRLFN